MTVIPPVRDYRTGDVFFQSGNLTKFEDQYVTLVVPASSDYTQIQLNSLSIFPFWWKEIQGPNSSVVAHIFNRQLSSYQLNKVINKDPASHFATFTYGFGRTLKHSFSYPVMADSNPSSNGKTANPQKYYTNVTPLHSLFPSSPCGISCHGVIPPCLLCANRSPQKTDHRFG